MNHGELVRPELIQQVMRVLLIAGHCVLYFFSRLTARRPEGSILQERIDRFQQHGLLRRR
jgi:hypothetical protein